MTGLCGKTTGRSGSWSATPGGGLRYSRNGADVSAAAALGALRGRSIVFLGDSNTRYQYLSLVSFLLKGAWPQRPLPGQFSVCHEDSVWSVPSLRQPMGQAMNAELRPRSDLSPILAPTYNLSSLKLFLGGGEGEGVPPRFVAFERWANAWKWRTFHNQSGRAFQGQELCECDRSTEMENRFVSIGGGDQPLRLSFSWLVSLQKHTSTMQEWPRDWGALRRWVRSTCSAGACNPVSPPLTLSALEAVQQRLRALQPDTVIFGPGPWMSGLHQRGRRKLRRFMLAVKQVVGPAGRAIFKSCPRGSDRTKAGCGNSLACDEPFRALLNETGWELFDLHRLTDELAAFQETCRRTATPLGLQHQWWRAANCTNPFSDNIHLQCDGYREVNRAFLGALGV